MLTLIAHGPIGPAPDLSGLSHAGRAAAADAEISSVFEHPHAERALIRGAGESISEKRCMPSKSRRTGFLLVGAAFAALAGCHGDAGGYNGGPVVPGPTPSPSPAPSPTPTPSPAPTSTFTAASLVSNVSGLTANLDPNLSHGWGIAFGTGGAVWVNNHVSNRATLYDGNGVPNALVVAIPGNAAGRDAAPTGIVANGDAAFTVSKAGVSGTAAFLFDGTGGTISGWAPGVDRTNAITVFDGSAAGDAFTGLAIIASGATKALYAANFGQGRVDVFDSTYRKVTAAGAFVDPTLPAGYAPYGIQAIAGQVYVSYAHKAAGTQSEDHAAGLGLIDVYDANGGFVKRLVGVGAALNAPWGMALAPATFGTFSNDLLVGNFGDGTINAYNPTTGAFIGTLSSASNTPIIKFGVRGLAFGNDVNNQPKTTLFFAEGFFSQGPLPTVGVYGRIDLNP
jgi:uncharacterized protein (TIGR03118 family)